MNILVDNELHATPSEFVHKLLNPHPLKSLYGDNFLLSRKVLSPIRLQIETHLFRIGSATPWKANNTIRRPTNSVRWQHSTSHVNSKTTNQPPLYLHQPPSQTSNCSATPANQSVWCKEPEWGICLVLFIFHRAFSSSSRYQRMGGDRVGTCLLAHLVCKRPLKKHLVRINIKCAVYMCENLV